MIKYVPELTSVVIEEIPDRLTLAVEISRCQGTCEGCHSPFLRGDIGAALTEDAVDRLFEQNFGVNCFLFLGEGDDRAALLHMADYIHSVHGVRVALYSGREDVEQELWHAFDYIKVGPYRAELGPLNRPMTNQRIYRVEHDAIYGDRRTDITSRLWRRGLDPLLNPQG